MKVFIADDSADYFLDKSNEFRRLVETVEQLSIPSQDTANNPG